jgi:hypothetical protein
MMVADFIVADEKQLMKKMEDFSFDDVMVEEGGYCSKGGVLDSCGRHKRNGCVDGRLQPAHIKQDNFVFGMKPAGKPESTTFLKSSDLPSWNIIRRVSVDLIRGLNFTGIGLYSCRVRR